MNFREYLKELAAEVGTGVEGKPVIRYFVPGNPKPFKFEELPEGQYKKVYKKFLEDLKKQEPRTFNNLINGKFDTSEMDIIIKGNNIVVKNEEGEEKRYVIPKVD